MVPPPHIVSQLDNAITTFVSSLKKGSCFTNQDLCDWIATNYPKLQNTLARIYGHGGAGCGRRYSKNHYIAQRVEVLRRKGMISIINGLLANCSHAKGGTTWYPTRHGRSYYVRARPGWGYPWVKHWIVT